MSDAFPIWLNGRLVWEPRPCISPVDRGFTLGDGVFETIRTHSRSPLWLEDHLARLRDGAELLGISPPFGDDALAKGVSSLLAATDHDESALRLTLSRGPSERRGLWPPDDRAAPTLLMTVVRLPPSQAPLRLAIAHATRRNEHSPLSRIKSLNYGDNLLARRDAAARGMDDALMLNVRGAIACATIGNIFLRVDGRWRTPPVSEGALPGLARRRLLSMLDVEETPVTRADLASAEMGFRSNSLGVSRVQEIEGRRLQSAKSLLEKLRLFAPE